jgi:hypothetical protein
LRIICGTCTLLSDAASASADPLIQEKPTLVPRLT